MTPKAVDVLDWVVFTIFQMPGLLVFTVIVNVYEIPWLAAGALMLVGMVAAVIAQVRDQRYKARHHTCEAERGT